MVKGNESHCSQVPKKRRMRRRKSGRVKGAGKLKTITR